MESSQAAGRGRPVDAYRKALATAASAAAYAVMARGVARELLPEELRASARWAASAVRACLGWGDKERRTLVVRSQAAGGGGGRGGGGRHDENLLFAAARAYLASKIDPHAVPRVGVTLARARDAGGRASWRRLLFVEPGDSTVDVFDGVRFTWTCVETPKGGSGAKEAESGGTTAGGDGKFFLELSFDAEHTATAMDRYLPFIMEAAEEKEERERELKICMNEGRMWYRMSHHHPATFDTLAMDPALKQSIVADLDLFASRREHYRRIGKAWKRGYLLHGPPGTGKSSLVAAMANHLRYHLYDLDLSHVQSNSALRWLLLGVANRSILVIEDIDCCCDAMTREDKSKTLTRTGDDGGDGDDNDGSDSLESPPARTAPAKPKPMDNKVTLSGLLNIIDGLWSTSGEERIIVFTTNYKERLDPALLRSGRMDMHVYMGYCGWEAFRTLAKNSFLVDDHALFPEIQELLSEVEVTPALVAEMLLRSEDADVALKGLVEVLREQKKQKGGREEN
ncbi:hypothetical protein ACP70R_004414 [Stipagrostis hirtigluma subsp. patula]